MLDAHLATQQLHKRQQEDQLVQEILDEIKTAQRSVARSRREPSGTNRTAAPSHRSAARKMATPKAFVGGQREPNLHDERRYEALKNLIQAKDKQIEMLKRVLAAKDKIYSECCEFIALMSHLLKRDNLKTSSKSAQKALAPFAKLLAQNTATAAANQTSVGFSENLGQARATQWPSALSSALTTVKSAGHLPPLPLSVAPKPSGGSASA